MTVETAQRAKEILEELEALRYVRKRVLSASNIKILLIEKETTFDTIRSKTDDPSSRYIQYIVDGIDIDIKKLEYELSRL